MPMPAFTIVADCPNGPRRETRVSPASAMVLADKWVQGGCSNVVLTDPDGVARERTAFRAELQRTRRLSGRFA